MVCRPDGIPGQVTRGQVLDGEQSLIIFGGWSRLHTQACILAHRTPQSTWRSCCPIRSTVRKECRLLVPSPLGRGR